jgi:hypothetical protein
VQVCQADTDLPILSHWDWRLQGFKGTDAYGWWRRFTSCSTHSWACAATQMTSDLRRCLTKLLSVPCKSDVHHWLVCVHLSSV